MPVPLPTVPLLRSVLSLLALMRLLLVVVLPLVVLLVVVVPPLVLSMAQTDQASRKQPKARRGEHGRG